MTRQELLSHENGEIFEVEGVKLQMIITKVAGDDFLKIKMYPITPLHDEAYLACKWIDYITDDECAEFECYIKKHKEKALEFYEQAQRVVKATLKDGKIKIIDVPQSVILDFCIFDDPQKALKRYIRDLHNISFIDKEKTEFYALGRFSLDIDGTIYTPHWSYWLDRPYYITSQQILNAII